MSVLLEVRGASTQNSEEKPFSEGITQHSGSQYGGGPLVSTWGDRLSSSIWHATAVSSPSITPVTTASSAFFPVSIASEAMDNEDRFSSTSSTLRDHSRKKGKESISGQEGSEFEANKGAFKQIVSDKTNYSFGATRSNPNASGMPYPAGLTKDWKAGIKFSDDPHHTPSPTISSEEKEEIVEKRDLASTSCSVDYMTSNSTNNSNEVHESISEHKEVPQIFVFGASIPSAVNSRHVSPQQRMFESLFVPSSPKTRNKYKRHLRLNKSGFGSNDTQQSASFSHEEVSPLKSSQVEDAEKYLDVNTGSKDNHGVNVDGLQQSKSIFIFGSDSVLHQNEESNNQQSFLSKYEQNELVEQMDNVEGHSSLFTSTKKSNEESRQTNDQVRASAWGFFKEGISFTKAKDGNILEEEEDVSSKKINENDANFGRGMEDEKGKHEYMWNSVSNFLPQPYVFGSLHASSTQVASQIDSLLSPIKDKMQATRTNSKGSRECVSLPTSSFSIPDVKNFGSLIDEPSQSYSSNSFMNVEGSFPGPNLNFTVQENRIQNEFPRGEFAGPVSSSESSEPESSPPKTEKNLSGDGILHPKNYFEFQGNLKNTVAGSAMGKKKVGLSLNSRRQRKGLNKLTITHKNGEIYSSVTKGPLSSMDFSSIMRNANPEDRIVNLEQFPENSNNLTEEWSEFIMEDKDQSMEDLQKAAANLRIQKDKKSSKSQSSNQESGVVEESIEWMSSNLSSKRSGSWKRSDFEEGECVSRLEKHSEASLLGRENEFANNHNGEGYSSSFEPNQEMLSFTVGTHSHISKVVESIFPSTGRVGGSFDKRSLRPQRRSFSKINQSSIQKKNSELPPSSSASSNAVDAGVLESINSGKSDAAERACEAWRLRGNLAYESGDYPRAEEYYSRGASSVSPSETSQSCIRASMLCYSNRAATRMAVGRMREALDDCKRAMVIDSSFVRVRLRAALCHLALGESKAATSFFKECIKYAKNSNEPNSKMLGDATEGAKKAQQLDDYSDRAMQLLSKENSTDSTAALRLVNEALSISPFSEALHELKTTALISLKRYEEALQWCEQTLPAAEKSQGVTVNEQHQDNFSNRATQNSENFHLKRWRWRLSAKCLYYLGKLEEAVDLLEKHEASLPTNVPDKNVDSLEKFMNSMRELARHKAAGNKAFQLGKHAEAVEHYTAALACNGESRPYNAVCFCNRAAASQALGHITDAIADCSRAIALDSSYPKALSRRATLHEMIRDYGQACNDLRRLITVLENNRSNERESQSSKEGALIVNVHDLKQAQDRMAKVEEEMHKGVPVDHYLLLGVNSTCSANEIKKAYRKAALKHHPDKASQFLKRENGDVGSLWKEVSIDEVRADAERLFKLIGEANAILSDPVKRSRYDNEEMRRQMRVTSSNFVPRTVSELFRQQYENSGSGLPPYYRWESRTASTNPTYTQHQRWQSAPDAAQPDTYARNRSNGGRTSTSEFSWDTS